MSDLFAQALRANLEAWEQEAAAYWDSLTRSPEFLGRVGTQLTRSMESYQHIAAAWRNAFVWAAISEQQGVRELYLLSRLGKQLDALAERLDRLENTLNDE
ncbi:MAG: hypothetical protein JW910_14545 [Anaerolineae bacterium]|nr:hypothetical protein [Anaerolineae bacterium]